MGFQWSLNGPLNVYLKSFFETMMNTMHGKFGTGVDEHIEICKEIGEVKEAEHFVHGASETLRSFGMTNAPGLKKKSKCDDGLQNVNIFFNEIVICQLVEVLIRNCRSKQPLSVMENAEVELIVPSCKSEPFAYVVSFILFGKMWRKAFKFREDSLQMREADRLYSILTTKVYDDRNRVKALFYEEIGYALQLCKTYSQSLVRELCQRATTSVNSEAKCGVKEVQEIHLVLFPVLFIMCKERNKYFLML